MLFCGGRGCSNLIRVLSSRPDIDLTLIINAYDDGLSTGTIRKFVPGLLGPSDFRKNLSVLLSTYSPEQHLLASALEYRLQSNTDIVVAKKTYLAGLLDANPQLAKTFDGLSRRLKNVLDDYTRTFVEFASQQEGRFPLDDAAFGNLVFAGAFLACERDFNRAVLSLVKSFRVSTQVVNVSVSVDRHLVALKEDGEILPDEASIVGEQSSIPIHDIFLLRNPLGADLLQELNTLQNLESKARRLLEHHNVPALSAEAAMALESADLVVLGAGSQHSSLLPSYQVVRESGVLIDPAKTVFVANLDADHDIKSSSVSDLVLRAENFLWADPTMKVGRILIDRTTTLPIGRGLEDRNICVADFRSATNPKQHSGASLAEHVTRELSGLKDKSVSVVACGPTKVAVEQFCGDVADLLGPLVQVVKTSFFVAEEAPWGEPPALAAIAEWLGAPDSDYLVTVIGDGLYDAADVCTGLLAANRQSLDVLSGSRVQSRRQWIDSSTAVHDGNRIRGRISRIVGALVSVLLLLRFGAFQSDCFSGFRIISRRSVEDTNDKVEVRGTKQPSRLTSIDQVLLGFVRDGVPATEIPISYRPFASEWKYRRPIRRLMILIRGLWIS